MSDGDEQDQGEPGGEELPADPFTPYDAERIARETGGEHVAVLQRAGQDRLTIGVLKHPHLGSLNQVAIRMWLGGKPTDAINLGLAEVLDMIKALREAVVICWPPPPEGRWPVPWRNGPEKRRQDAARYRDPEYLKNKPLVLRRANGRCERCGKRTRLQVDHIIPLAVQVDHSLPNLMALCCGPGSCHAAKTARDSHAGQRRQRDPAFTTSRTRW
jgi:hypothetical protein